jgi:hypothetical protein
MTRQTKCGAKRQRTGTPCRSFAMANGRCRVHGGATPPAPVQHGLRSIRYKGRLAERAAEFLADDDPGNLLPELAIARALLQARMERVDQQSGPTGDDIADLSKLIDHATKIVERMARIEDRHALTMAEVKFLTARLADILVRYVPADQRQAALDDLESSFPGLH